MNDLQGRRAIVTGAAQGIGLAIAQRLVAGGARVALVDINGDAASAAAAALGRDCIGITCDVRSTADVNAAVDAAAAAFGGLDLLVNNAGIEIAKPVTELTDDDFTAILDINVVGTFRFTKAAVPALAAAGASSIVNLGSIASVAGGPLLSAYTASKGAVLRFTESAAIELRGAGIRVNAVCPGTVDTDLVNPNNFFVDIMAAMESGGFDAWMRREIPIGRLQQAEEVASVIAFLMSDDAGYITGEAVNVSGGQMMA